MDDGGRGGVREVNVWEVFVREPVKRERELDGPSLGDEPVGGEGVAPPRPLREHRRDQGRCQVLEDAAVEERAGSFIRNERGRWCGGSIRDLIGEHAFIPRAFVPRAFVPRAFVPRAFLPRAFVPHTQRGAKADDWSQRTDGDIEAREQALKAKHAHTSSAGGRTEPWGIECQQRGGGIVPKEDRISI